MLNPIENNYFFEFNEIHIGEDDKSIFLIILCNIIFLTKIL